MRNALIPTLILLLAAPAVAQEPDEPEPEKTPRKTPPAPAAPAPFLASDPRDLFRKGVELAERGSVEQAKAVFRSLTLAYPQLPEPYVNLAVLLAAQGAEDEAANTAEAAILLHPVCRAAFRLELLRDIGGYSAGLLGDAAGTAEVQAARPVTPPAAGAQEAEVRAVTATVEAWARAWSEQRADDVLAFYAASFRPPEGLTREAWEAQRRRRLSAPSFIEVTLSDLAVELTAPGRAAVTFTQTYRSDTYGDVVKKTLELERVEGVWKIVAQRVDG